MPRAREHLRAVELLLVGTRRHDIESLIAKRSRRTLREAAHFRRVDHFDGDASASHPLRIGE
jgi:hypothetical protein